MSKLSSLEDTRNRLTEIQGDIDGVKLLLVEAENNQRDAFNDAQKYSKASAVVAVLRVRLEDLQEALVLGKALEAKQKRETHQREIDRLEKLLADARKTKSALTKKQDVLEKQRQTLDREIYVAVERERDLSFMIENARREQQLA